MIVILHLIYIFDDNVDMVSRAFPRFFFSHSFLHSVFVSGSLVCFQNGFVVEDFFRMKKTHIHTEQSSGQNCY